MDRCISRGSPWRAALALSLVALTASAIGCKGLFSTVAYLVHGTDVPAAYDGLRNQRVAVVVHTSGRARSIDEEHAAPELAQRIGAQLTQNVRGITVIGHQEVDRWKDDLNNADKDDVRALGAALKADKVMVVELDGFRLNNNSTSLYIGHCDYRIVVHDVADPQGRAAWEHNPTQTMTYPPNHGIPIGDKTRAGFRRIFVAALAEEIAQKFYAHDKTVHFARDSDSLEYH